MCEHHQAQVEAEQGAPQAGPQLVDIGRMDRRDLLRGLATGTLLVLAPGCATNPTTGRSQLMLVNERELVGMSLSAWQEMKQKTPISRDPGLNARLSRVGTRIAQVSGLQGQQWEFVVFDSPERNAFVLPGGKVGFYRGLMEIADKDDHIATVVGHEVGHVSGRHAAERFSQSTAAQLGLAVGTVAIAGATQNTSQRQLAAAALGLGVQVGILLPYSRAQESEADRIGVDYMHAAGYDVRESLVFWRRMNGAGNGNRPPAFLSTHPDPIARMEGLRQYINSRGYALV